MNERKKEKNKEENKITFYPLLFTFTAVGCTSENNLCKMKLTAHARQYPTIKDLVPQYTGPHAYGANPVRETALNRMMLLLVFHYSAFYQIQYQHNHYTLNAILLRPFVVKSNVILFYNLKKRQNKFSIHHLWKPSL